MIKKRIGIFGGTFNPPHIGHVRAAKAFSRQMELDQLLIIPDYIPPHKDYVGNVSPDDRLNMCKIAFGDIDGSVISDIEIKRGGRSYTYITLEELRSDGCELYLLVGTDMFITLDRWVHPEIIFNIADICCIRRESDEENTRIINEKAGQYKNLFDARIHFVDADVTEMSSTEIRKLITSDSSEECLPESLLEYIRSEGLYNDQ